ETSVSVEPDYVARPHYPRPMSHAARVEFMLRNLGRRGIRPTTAAPPFFRLLWKLGYEVPPPLFLGFGKNALLMGGTYGLVMAGAIYLFLLSFVTLAKPYSLLGLFAGFLWFVLLFGIPFGLAMAAVVRWTARPLALPAWRDYPRETDLLVREPE